jgi:lysophospholipase L1-like esterase
MKFRPLLKKLALAGASLFVAFAGAEIIARLNEPGPFSFFDHSPNDPDPKLDHVHRPGFVGRWDGTWYEINSRGLRGPDWTPTFSEKEFRILALGDSCTFGKGVLESECWPRQLETLMRGGAHSEVHVANAGVNGYSGRQYLEVLRRLGPELKPQLVLVGYNLNDFPNVVQSVDRAVFQGKNSLRAKLPTGLRDELGRLALFRWMRASYYEMNRERDWANAEKLARESAGVGPKATSKAALRFEEEKQRLKQLVEESRELGAKVAIFLLPYESQVYLDVFDDTPVQSLRAVCDELGVTFVDLAEPFRARARASDPPRLFLRGDRYHPTAEGYRIVADSVIHVLREQGWLPVSH